jgi:hypothetical protein
VGLAAVLAASPVAAHIVYGGANLRQQIAAADVVARALIVDADDALVLDDPPLRRPVVSARLLEVLKGAAERGPVRFAQHGHGVAKFVDGEEVMLFLRYIERSDELNAPRLAAAIRYVSLQQHDARYSLAGESGERFVAAARAYLAIDTIRDPKARLAAQRQLTLEMLHSDEPSLAISALQDLVQHDDLELVSRDDAPILVARIEDAEAAIGLRVGLLAELQRRALVDGTTLWVKLLRTTRGTDLAAVIRAAGAHPSSPVTAELIRILDGKDGPAARIAAVALGTPGNDAATQPLARALDNADARLRMAAIRGLGRIATPAARAALESAATSHADPGTRRRSRAEANLLARGAPSASSLPR